MEDERHEENENRNIYCKHSAHGPSGLLRPGPDHYHRRNPAVRIRSHTAHEKTENTSRSRKTYIIAQKRSSMRAYLRIAGMNFQNALRVS